MLDQEKISAKTPAIRLSQAQHDLLNSGMDHLFQDFPFRPHGKQMEFIAYHVWQFHDEHGIGEQMSKLVSIMALLMQQCTEPEQLPGMRQALFYMHQTLVNQYSLMAIINSYPVLHDNWKS